MLIHKEKERISKPKNNPIVDEVQKQEVLNQKMKPQVPKSQKENVFKTVLENQEISRISDFGEQKKMFTSLWVQSNMIFPQPQSKFSKSKQVWIPKNI